MSKQHRGWRVGLAASITIGLFSAVPSAFAATDTSQTNTLTDLTSLGTISTTVTGLPDATFLGQEQSYQQPLTSNIGWRGFNRQGGRDITIQFTKPVDVQHIAIMMLQDQPLGVYFPDDVEFEFEQNGQWYSAGKRYSAIPQSDEKVMTQTYQFNQSQGVETTAVRLHIPVAVWVFARGLSITGSTTEQGLPASRYTSVPATAKEVGPLAPSNPRAHGISNMLLVETGDHGSEGRWTTDDFKPMVAYINQNGQISGSMFDTMLFLPYNSIDDTATGLTNYLNDLFAPNQQLSALDAAVAQTNQALNRPDYKEKVVLTIPYFSYGTHDFGQVDGQDIQFGGSASDLNGLQARETALNWYLSSLLKKWKAADFQHLQLVGLYWDEEKYEETMPGERDLLANAVQTVHSDQLPLFWIPFYGADKTEDWQTLGFDAAWIQPNYVEQGDSANDSRISNAMQTAKQSGMGIEVELTGLDAAHQQLYNTFLQKLDMEGFGQNQVSHVFYDGSKLLVSAANSTNLADRLAYDSTAAFIQGK